MNFFTRLIAPLRGRHVGTDNAGNRYFIDARPAAGTRPRRWVVYPGATDAASIPAQWQAWLQFNAS